MARRKQRGRRTPQVRPTPPQAVAAPAASPDRGGRLPVLVGWALGLGVLAAYMATAARDLVFGDSPELTGAAITLGVAHPPGYPVWTMLAHLFTLVPVGTFTFRVSALSACCAAGCVALVYVSGYRLGRNVLAAAIAAALLALTPLFWSWSVVPEVFALNDLLAAALVALLLIWHADQRPRAFVAASFIGGLGMANQQTIALVAPAVFYLMWHHRQVLGRDWLFVKGGLAFLAGLIPYAYLPWAASRSPVWNWGDISSGGDLFAHVFRTAFGTGQLVGAPSVQGGSAVDRVIALGMSFDLGAVVLIALGAFVLFRRDRVACSFLAGAFVLAGPAFVAYANVNSADPLVRAVLERFFLLPQVVVAPLGALGLRYAADRVSAALGRVRQRTAALAIGTASLGLALGVAALNFPAIDHHDDQTARRYAEDILASAPQGAVLLAGGDAAIWPIGYLRTIEGARPDLTFLNIPLLTSEWYVRQQKRQHPELIFKAPRYDGHVGTARDLVEPNGPERFEIFGGVLDDSLSATEIFVRRGLLYELRPKTTTVDVDALAALNDSLLRTYHIPALAEVASRTWDRAILGDYGLVAFDIAQDFEFFKRYPQARDWYGRALAIDPDLTEARSALAGLPR